MRIGIPKEIKPQEYRVALTPDAVAQLTQHGHQVCVETSAGAGIGVDDQDYSEAGASIASSPEDLYSRSQLIVKVKEPQPGEWPLLRPDHIVYAYLHLAPDPEQAGALMDSRCTAIAFETVTDSWGRLPLLAPMSEVAGRMAAQVGAEFLQKFKGGRGILMGGAAGVAPARVVVIGSGMVGENAARMATGLGANVTVVGRSVSRLRDLESRFDGRIETAVSTTAIIAALVSSADVIVGAAMVAGGKTPTLVSEQMVHTMNAGSVIVDVSIDQGGCCATSRPTTHADPVFIVDDVVHYCVANMPGAVPRTSSFALSNAILPHALALSDKGLDRALADDINLANGVNVRDGRIVHAAVAAALN